MRQVKLAIAALAMLSISANAGKNYVPATVEPIPLPTVIPPLGFYIGGGLTYAASKCQCDTSVQFSDGTTSKARSGHSYGGNLRVGYNLNEYIGIEGKYIKTAWGDDGKKLTHYGLYLKPSYAITENLDIYALLGYGKTSCESLMQTYTGFAWGGGAEYTLNKRVQGQKDGLGVYVEYLRPLKKSGNKNITVDMVNAGVNYNF